MSGEFGDYGGYNGFFHDKAWGMSRDSKTGRLIATRKLSKVLDALSVLAQYISYAEAGDSNLKKGEYVRMVTRLRREMERYEQWVRCLYTGEINQQESYHSERKRT